MDEQNQQPQAVKAIEKVFQNYMLHFPPASSTDDANEQLTTREIREQLEDFIGNEIPDHDVFNLLLQNNYTFDYYIDGFKWLLKMKTK